MDINETLEERGKIHGNWTTQAQCAQSIKLALKDYAHYSVPAELGEALDMIAVKMSRIVCGDSCELDHWRDIQGYAELGRRAAAKGSKP